MQLLRQLACPLLDASLSLLFFTAHTCRRGLELVTSGSRVHAGHARTIFTSSQQLQSALAAQPGALTRHRDRSTHAVAGCGF